MAVKPIPEGYSSVTPYLYVDGAAAAIDFYTEVFGAKEEMRMGAPGDKVGHAEIRIGNSVVMLADAFPDMGTRDPKTLGGTTFLVNLYVEDADGVYERAIAAGAKPIRPVENQFYGDRSGQFEDPFGHQWNVATHVEDVPPDELARRAAEVAGL